VYCVGALFWEFFFETHESYEHLALIEKASGTIPFWMANRAEVKLRKNFNVDDEHMNNKQGSYFDWPKHAASDESINNVRNMKTITDIIPAQYGDLVDLLQKMLAVDPNKRIKSWEALEHPFFKTSFKMSKE